MGNLWSHGLWGKSCSQSTAEGQFRVPLTSQRALQSYLAFRREGTASLWWDTWAAVVNKPAAEHTHQSRGGHPRHVPLYP
jgi:hypothetical protein